MKYLIWFVFFLMSSSVLWSQTVHSVTTNGSGRIFIATEKGILRSEDEGLHWSYKNKNIWDSTAVYKLSADTLGNVFAATGYTNIYYSTDNGDNWTTVSSNQMSGGVYCLSPNNKGQLFLGNNGGIFRLDSLGGNWIKLTNGILYDPAVLSMVITDSGKIYMSATAVGPIGQVEISYLSTDNGNNWQRSDSGRVFWAITHQGEDTIFAGGYHTGLYRSTNGGTSWQLFGSGLENTWIRTFAKNDTYIYMGSTTSQGIYRMLHLGDSLQYLSSSPPNVESLAIISDFIYAGTQSGLFYSTNKGETWLPLDAIVMSNEERFDELPKTFQIKQNYPNPFNPKTTIKYEIPKTSNIKIVLYNSIGQKIKTLYSGKQSVGSHSIELDGDDIPSGVYIYQIEAGDYREARKCLLLK